MHRFKRYLVVGNNGTTSHSYSTEIKSALQDAMVCAKHWSMFGDVYGVLENGQKELVWKNERIISRNQTV